MRSGQTGPARRRAEGVNRIIGTWHGFCGHSTRGCKDYDPGETPASISAVLSAAARRTDRKCALLGNIWNSIRQPLSRPPANPGEPARTLERALRWLGQISAGGIAIPDAVKLAVLNARKESAANNGTLTPDTASALYDAYSELAPLAARLDDDKEVPLADSFTRAVINSEYLLKYASESGTPVPDNVQNDLIAGQATLGTKPEDLVKSKFYRAYAALAKLAGNVTADTIKACRSARTRRTLRRDERRALALASVTVVVSVVLFTVAAINDQLTDEVTTANDLAIKLRGIVFPAVGAGAQPAVIRDEYIKDPCDALVLPPRKDEFTVHSQADLDQIQQFAIAIRGARSRAGRLNAFIAYSECDPFGRCSWQNDGHNASVAQMLADDAQPRMRDRFELNPTLSNYTAEFLCKVQTWQEVRDFAVNIQKSYSAIYGGLVAHALPILYALLGAYAYRLRQFSESMRTRTFHPSYADSARVITAVIAGAVAGLFNPVRDLAVSPLATAFLVGYGVEIFFRFIDTLLNSLGSAAPGAARPPPAPDAAAPQQAAGGGAGG